jgi:hypothetical protein
MKIESVNLNMPTLRFAFSFRLRDVCAQKAASSRTQKRSAFGRDKLTITKQRLRSRVALSRVTLFEA